MRTAERIARLSLAAAAVAAAACGGAASSNPGGASAIQERQYSCEHDVVFDAAVQVMQAEFGKLHSQDKAAGEVIGEPRWHDKDGAARREGIATAELKDGDIALAVRVRLVDLKPNFQVLVDSVVKQWKSGSPQPRDLLEGDPNRPAWVQGRMDRVANGIHERLSSCSVLTRHPH